MNSYPIETDEFVKVVVTANGVAQTSGVTFAVVADGARPVTFTAAKVRGSDIGVEVTGLTAGVWRIYAKATDTPYAPVIDCGVFRIA